MTTATYRNPTDKGNVAALRIEVCETPYSLEGKAHARLIAVLRDGAENTRLGKSWPTLDDAEKQASEWKAQLEKSGLVLES